MVSMLRCFRNCRFIVTIIITIIIIFYKIPQVVKIPGLKTKKLKSNVGWLEKLKRCSVTEMR